MTRIIIQQAVRGSIELDRRTSALLITSDYVQGIRLSNVLAEAQKRGLALEFNAVRCLIRQLVTAAAALHGAAPDVGNGAIAPERLVLTPAGRLTIVEYVLGAALSIILGRWRSVQRVISLAVLSSAVVFSVILLIGADDDTSDFEPRLPWLRELARRFAGIRVGRTWAVDSSPTAAAFVKERGFARIAVGSATDLPYPDETFDLVTAFGVIEMTTGCGRRCNFCLPDLNPQMSIPKDRIMKAVAASADRDPAIENVVLEAMLLPASSSNVGLSSAGACCSSGITC